MRIVRIVGGLLLAFVNSQGGADTILGFYAPDSAQRVGFDVVKVLIYGVCGWLIYRDFKPAIKQPVT